MTGGVTTGGVGIAVEIRVMTGGVGIALEIAVEIGVGIALEIGLGIGVPGGRVGKLLMGMLGPPVIGVTVAPGTETF